MYPIFWIISIKLCNFRPSRLPTQARFAKYRSFQFLNWVLALSNRVFAFSNWVFINTHKNKPCNDAWLWKPNGVEFSSWPDPAIPVTTPAVGSGPTCSSVPLIVTSLDVDSDSPSDHHPGDPTLSSSKNEGSLDDSFSSSQAAGSSAADSKHILKDPSEDDFDVVKLISNGKFQISNKRSTDNCE